MLITSIDNKKIKLYYKLKDSKFRQQNRLYLVEGMHLVKEAYEANVLDDLLLLTDDTLEFNYAKEVTYVSENILKKLSSLTNYSHVIGVCHMKDNMDIIGNKVLILDNIQDPGNLGTIIRSSCAFNVDTLVLSKDTVDLYNDKVLRSSQGMVFKVNIVVADIKEVINKLKNDHYLILGTNVKDGIDVNSVSANKYALIMGNEGSGISKDISSLCDKNIYIKMNKNCESLNVGVATSILLYELNRGYHE